MSPTERNSTPWIILPFWQVTLVLVGLPVLYMANSLMPWAAGLFRRHDHAFFLQFWGSIVVMHWGCVALVGVLLKRAGRQWTDIGLALSPLRSVAMVGIPLIVGVALIVLRETSGASPPGAQASPVLPATMGERLFWIFMSFTAGFCEEVVYRGFLIRGLQGRNLPTWLACGAATLAFVLMHGRSVLAPSPFLTIGISGLLFSLLFLWRRSLVPGICLHGLIDVLAINSS